jgi:two-component system alkaline phosphatase synthesis response regulator PhoP
MEDNNTKNNSTLILLVDDEASILELYSEVLREAGFTVETASNGNEALTKASEKEYGLILLDIMMNDGPDGLEVLRIMRSDKDKYKHPIILMLTNLAITNNVKDAFDYGADGYMIKLALSNEQLVKQVNDHLYGFRK